jgi:2-methylisocitrate lyase-like PEP mutase family enzyme
VTDAARRICRSVDVPVIVDADTGYGGVLNVIRTVRELIEAGARGCFLEDQVWPKRCGHMTGKSVIPAEEHVRKIRAAVDARGAADFFVVARTDAREALGSLEEAIARAAAYKAAGADAVFVEAPQSLEELREIAHRVEPPFVANMLEGGVTPILDRDELAALGFRIAVFPLTALFAAARAQQDVFAHLKAAGTTRDILDRLLTFHDFHDLVGLEARRALDKRYSAG